MLKGGKTSVESIQMFIGIYNALNAEDENRMKNTFSKYYQEIDEIGELPNSSKPVKPRDFFNKFGNW
jgi:hypothetical protein